MYESEVVAKCHKNAMDDGRGFVGYLWKGIRTPKEGYHD